MTFSLGWHRRDEEGRRVKVEFHLIRQKASWKQQAKRNEKWELFTPTATDWTELMETVERHLGRGKVTHEDFAIIKELERRQRS